MAWTDIADADIDANSPMNTTLMTRLRDNQVALQEVPWWFDVATYAATPALANTFYLATSRAVFIPKSAKKGVLVVYLSTASGTATIEVRVNGTALTSDQKTSTSATPARKELTFTDLTSVRDSYVTFEVWVKSSVPASTTISADTGPTSRFAA